jgi:hypothetical protein
MNWAECIVNVGIWRFWNAIHKLCNFEHSAVRERGQTQLKSLSKHFWFAISMHKRLILFTNIKHLHISWWSDPCHYPSPIEHMSQSTNSRDQTCPIIIASWGVAIGSRFHLYQPRDGPTWSSVFLYLYRLVDANDRTTSISEDPTETWGEIYLADFNHIIVTFPWSLILFIRVVSLISRTHSLTLFTVFLPWPYLDDLWSFIPSLTLFTKFLPILDRTMDLQITNGTPYGFYMNYCCNRTVVYGFTLRHCSPQQFTMVILGLLQR